jgi:glycerol-3-phosphate dehydrogenase
MPLKHFFEDGHANGRAPMTVEQPAYPFSIQARQETLRRLREETFDLLVVGGGITGAAVARDALSRGLTVALIERDDFASGTSSGSSKLIHGGFRYLENLEFGLVFESVSERTLLLKTAPHMVRPLRFYMPIFAGDRVGMATMSAGMWLYDALALFRSPGFHKRLSAKALQALVPALKQKGLRGGFRYYDASMWDDMLVIENLRAAHKLGLVAANYLEAVEPVRDGERIAGFVAEDRAGLPAGDAAVPRFPIRAKKVVMCVGPWLDQLGLKMEPHWNKWLTPSKGVHLLFDMKRLPLPGTVIMSNNDDGRISFAIPRPDMGAGVVIVGTSDSPSPERPEELSVEADDIAYLMGLLNRFFPSLNLTSDDIVSSYAGIRPLFAPPAVDGASRSLQKISREHHIGVGPGGVVLIAGGKYTTHRRMATEIVDFTLKNWAEETRPPYLKPSNTEGPLNPGVMPAPLAAARQDAEAKGLTVAPELWSLYGAAALEIVELDRSAAGQGPADPEGFPSLAGQLRFMIREGMVVHLQDFYLRRAPLFLTRKDHGLPWAARLADVWAAEAGFDAAEARREETRLRAEIERRAGWTEHYVSGSVS